MTRPTPNGDGMMETDAERVDAAAVIARIAEAAETFALHANVGGMETAGSIVSYLAEHPEQVEAFMAEPSILDWPSRWHVNGRLTWHGMDGKVHTPEEARRQTIIEQMKATPTKDTSQ